MKQSDMARKLAALESLLQIQLLIVHGWCLPNFSCLRAVLKCQKLDIMVKNRVEHILSCSSAEECDVLSKSTTLRAQIEQVKELKRG